MAEQGSSIFFSGSVSEAITVASGRKLLIVYVAGSDDDSRMLESNSFGDELVSNFVRGSCIALRLIHGSADAIFFSALYPVDRIPVVAVIGMKGSRLAWIEGFVPPDELRRRLEEANEAFKAQLDQAAVVAAATMATMLNAARPAESPVALPAMPPATAGPAAGSGGPASTQQARSSTEPSAVPSAGPVQSGPLPPPNEGLKSTASTATPFTTASHSTPEPAQPSSRPASAVTENDAPSTSAKSFSSGAAGPAPPDSGSLETPGNVPEPSEPLPQPAKSSAATPKPASERLSATQGPPAAQSLVPERPGSAALDMGHGPAKVGMGSIPPGRAEAGPEQGKADVGPRQATAEAVPSPAEASDVGAAKSDPNEQPRQPDSAGNPTKPAPVMPKPRPERFEVQFRLTDGGSLRGEFAAKDRLRIVREYIDVYRSDGHEAYYLAELFPRRTFGEQDMDKTLEDLGFGPRMALVLLPVPGQLRKVRGARLPPDGASSSGGPEGARPGWTLTGTVGNLLSFVNPLSLLGGSPARAGTPANGGQPTPPSWQYEADPQLEQQIRAMGTTPASRSADGQPGPRGMPVFLGGGMANMPPGGRGGAPPSGSRRIAGNVHTFNREEDPSESMRGGNMFWNGNSTQFGGDGNNNDKK